MSNREALIDAAIIAIAEHAAEWGEVKGYHQVQLSDEVRCSLREIVAIVVDACGTWALDDGD